MSLWQQISTPFVNAWDGIKHLFTDDVQPFISETLQLIERNGGAALLKIAADVEPLLVEKKFGEVITVILADLKAAGIQTLEDEENLAAATALQFAQNAANAAATLQAAAAANPNPAPNTGIMAAGNDATAATGTAAPVVGNGTSQAAPETNTAQAGTTNVNNGEGTAA